MKTHHIISILLLAQSLYFSPTFAEESTSVKGDSVRYALSLLTGTSGRIDTLQAVERLQRYADDGNPIAMNAVGIFYLQGTGVERDIDTGIAWLEASAEKGYPYGYFNIAMIYKLGQYGISQDFTTAYDYMLRSYRHTGSAHASHLLGYFHYKGIGCEQNYAIAADYFLKGARQGYEPCMYMLGLCYRNGYGLERDEDMAQIWLEASAELNYTPAMRELLSDTPEYILECESEALDHTADIPTQYMQVSPISQDEALTGEYSGTLVVYDWSGKHILYRKELQLSLYEQYGALSGIWIEAGDTVLLSGTYTDGTITFDNTEQKRRDHYAPKGMWYAFETAHIALSGNMLTGNVAMRSFKDKEPERPIYFYVSRTDDKNENDTKLYTYPNPFSDELTAHFSLDTSCSVSMGIYTAGGINLYWSNLGTMDSGAHAVTLRPTIADGTYLLKLYAGADTYETVIIKKGGGL